MTGAEHEAMARMLIMDAAEDIGFLTVVETLEAEDYEWDDDDAFTVRDLVASAIVKVSWSSD